MLPFSQRRAVTSGGECSYHFAKAEDHPSQPETQNANPRGTVGAFAHCGRSTAFFVPEINRWAMLLAALNPGLSFSPLHEGNLYGAIEDQL